MTNKILNVPNVSFSEPMLPQIARYAVSWLGVYLATSGILSAEDVSTLVSSVDVLVGVVLTLAPVAYRAYSTLNK